LHFQERRAIRPAGACGAWNRLPRSTKVEAAMVQQMQSNWLMGPQPWLRRAVTWPTTQIKRSYDHLKIRYGPRYARAMLAVAFLSLFSPFPGSTLVGITAIVLIAETHRVIARVRAIRQPARMQLMSINCAVIVQSTATPAQFAELGAALWRWCARSAGDAGIYRYLDDQPLADLIAGKAPVSSFGDRPGVYFRAPGEASHDRQATIDSLRRDLPAEGLEDLLVNGKSWN
jgi:hypothetical protein